MDIPLRFVLPAIGSALLVGCTNARSSTNISSKQATPGFNTHVPESILTPDRVETSIGTLEFFDGLPNEATIETLYDNLDRIPGTEVFLNFIPAASRRRCHPVPIHRDSSWVRTSDDTVRERPEMHAA